MKPHLAPLLTLVSLACLLIAVGGCTADPSAASAALENASMFVTDLLRQVAAAFLL